MNVTLVRACLRDGRGGSPTAVLDDGPLTDEQRREVPVRAGTSHAVFLSTRPASAGAGTAEISLRFFTGEGELPGCGHGTVAALAVLADRTGTREVTLRTRAGALRGRAVRHPNGGLEAWFVPGPVALRAPRDGEHEDVLAALGLAADTPGAVIASLGRPRLLLPLPTRSALAALTPDPDRLRAACDRRALLGCYLYSAPAPDGRVAARMFAPSIGVPEDIANANSTACLAAHLAREGLPGVTADMGDALGTPATITAVVRSGSDGPEISVGGTAKITDEPAQDTPGTPHRPTR
ncbi:PhzF family phenazine biosynthesis isomerase [Streptomyces sp. NPDC005827]|uniref:PhzF family phenazine biosynthesis protein n=1 Tax=Streptomyces sp. NPDC005827 TaxID=3157070 RepID=UPI0033D75E51